MSFTGVEGGSNPPSQTFNITNTGGGTLSWTLTETASWLGVSPANGATNSSESNTVSVTVGLTGLSARTYSTTLIIGSSSASNPSQSIPVNLTVTPPPPVIGFSPISLSFTAIEGWTQTSNQTLDITNTGDGTLNWSISSDAGWLTVSPSSGTTTTETDVVTVTVNPSGLQSNAYTGNLTISDSNATNNPRKVLASYSITQPTSGTATLLWDPNTESDLAGYKVYAGTTSGAYGTPVDVGNITEFEILNLSSGKTFYFAVTAYNTSGNESGFSNEVSKTIP